MTIWYGIKKWNGAKIEPVEVDKQTELSVWINGNRQARASEYTNYFPTWEEAHAYLLNRTERNLENARLALEHAQGEYSKVTVMKKPVAA